MKKKTMVIDLDKCIGCYACEVACKMENDVDLGVYYTRVLTVGPTGDYPKLEQYHMTGICQSCKEPPCVAACPTGASYINDNGVILIDKARCIGCRECQQACPYGARSYNARAKVTEKCTLCSHLTDGNPACVKNCCTKARSVGDVEDPNSDVSKLLKAVGAANVHSVFDAGNDPSVRYILHAKYAKWQEREDWQFFPETNT
jgi:Fe-S-cluster-containing dehydrogenase component